nr:MAG TPA: hypothetical protein [Caudoviricetes sp.]DAK74658.1 MAG TPA: hypothetical protein [Caudoviricetes sp.]DAX43525.1 MAG TPA: hypothetical protein [Caudoviricetes sp.]
MFFSKKATTFFRPTSISGIYVSSFLKFVRRKQLKN